MQRVKHVRIENSVDSGQKMSQQLILLSAIRLTRIRSKSNLLLEYLHQ